MDTDGRAELHTKEFGAVGDGNTDDSAALQTAIDAAAEGHAILLFDSGDYCISKQLEIRSGSEWIANTTTVTIRSLADNVIINADGINGASVSGITLLGNMTERPLALMIVYKSDNIVVSDVSFQNTRGMGAIFSNTNNSSVLNNRFYDVGNPLHLYSSETLISNAKPGLAFTTDSDGYGINNSSSHNEFNAIGLDAISATGQYNFTASYNSFSNLTTTNEWIDQPAGGAGIYSYGNDYVTLVGNNIQRASGNGIDIAHSNHVVVDSNNVTYSGYAGILLSNTDNSIIRNNVSMNNNQWNRLNHRSGIVFIDPLLDDPNDLSQSSENDSIVGNVLGNSPGKFSQMFDIQLSNLKFLPTISSDNKFVGQVIMPIAIVERGDLYEFSSPHELKINSDTLTNAPQDGASNAAGTLSIQPNRSDPPIGPGISNPVAPAGLELDSNPELNATPAANTGDDKANSRTGVNDSINQDGTYSVSGNIFLDVNLFDKDYYLANNGDVAASGMSAEVHYLTTGWREGRDPSSLFSTEDYLAANPDVKAAGINPLLHYIEYGKAEGRASFAVSHQSNDLMVDSAYYYAHNPDVKVAGVDATAHYLELGWKEGRNPDAFFDTSYYLSQNPDVKAAGVNPLLHFEVHGWKEGRQPSLVFDNTKYLLENPDVAAAGIDPLFHYIQYGLVEGRAAHLIGSSSSPDLLVNTVYYDLQLGATIIPTTDDATRQATWSYDAVGWQQGLNPNAFFNTSYYLSENPDVAMAHINPLLHYESAGWREGRDPSPTFSTSKYLTAYSDVRQAGLNPLLHYIQYGENEGRTAFPV